MNVRENHNFMDVLFIFLIMGFLDFRFRKLRIFENLKNYENIGSCRFLITLPIVSVDFRFLKLSTSWKIEETIKHP